MTTTTFGVHTRPAAGRTAAARAALKTWHLKAGATAGRIATRAAGMRRAALTVGGFGFIDAGIYRTGLIAGLVATGVSLWLLEWLSD